MKEVEISIKGLFFYILKKWKSVLAAMIIGAIAIGGLQMLRSAVEAKNVDTSAEVGGGLTDSEKDYVESVYYYLNDLRRMNESRRDSLIMKLDSENVAENELIYMISVNDSDNMEGVEQAFRNYLMGAEFIGFVSDKTGMNSEDIDETVTISYERSRDSALHTVLRIIIVSGDKSDAEEISKVVTSYMNQKSTELLQNGYDHELTEIGCSTYQVSDINIQNSQLQYLQEIQYRNRTILDTENSITGTQKEYYVSLMDASDTEGVNGSTAETQDITHVRPSGKYIAIGLIIGALVMCGIYLLVYVFGNRLDEEDDVEGLFGTYLLGVITGDDYGKIIYKLQHIGKRTFNHDDSVRIISTKVKMSLQKNGISKVGILGCGIKKNNEKVANDIIAALEKNGIEAILIDEPIYDPSSAEKLCEIDRVILLEKVGVTYRTEVWKEIELTEKLGVSVDGLILAE